MNLIFDYDGTLHDCIKIYAPAFRKAYARLVSLSLAEERAWPEREISQWLGFSANEMWDRFLPALPQSLKDECSRIIGDEMLRLVRAGQARLYPGTLETLKRLRQSHTLIFLSNCKRSYMEAHIGQFYLDDYFSAFYCAEDFNFQEKYKIFDIIKQDSTGEFIVIGDRLHDMEVARTHGLKAIGCVYGYGQPGELAQADLIASGVEEIVPCLERMPTALL